MKSTQPERPYYVYAIGVDGDEWGDMSGAIKIGVGGDPENRLNALQTGSPARLVIHKVWKFECESDAREFETSCHKEFAPVNLMREWFMVSVEEVDRFLTTHIENLSRRDELDDLVALLKRAKKEAAYRTAVQNAGGGPRRIGRDYPQATVTRGGVHCLLTTKEAAEYIGVSPSWLNKSRMKGSGPAYLKIGGLVKYKTEQLDEWLLERQRTAVYDFAQRRAA